MTAAESSRSAAGCVSALRQTATVAPNIARSMKKCQGWKPESARDGRRSVEVTELVIEALFERRVWRGRVGGAGGLRDPVPPGPAEGKHADEADAGGADRVRQEPRQSVEPLIQRRGEHFLTAPLRDEVLNDLVVGLAFARQ